MLKRTVTILLLAASAPHAGCSRSPQPTGCRIVIAPDASPKPTGCKFVIAPDASPMEQLAAREVRRYLYLRTRTLLPIIKAARVPADGSAIVVSRKGRTLVSGLSGAGSLAPQQYILRTEHRGARTVLYVAGGDPAGTLYGAYRLAERIGVRFYLHGDTIPDSRIPFELPSLNESGRPLFALRGIQPFHDFPEGPDWWSSQEYLAIVGQLPKLRMNFIGLHTYPENGPSAEPTVWIGPPSDMKPDGNVSASYPAAYQDTLLGTWGYAPRRTSDFLFGAAQLFDQDVYGAEVMRGLAPRPTTPSRENLLFDRTAAMLNAAFREAHALGVKTCVGTETPLTIPKDVQDRLAARGKSPKAASTVRDLYEGIFTRAAKAYPLDYYWLWTPEGWTWSGTTDAQVQATIHDMQSAYDALKRTRAPFRMATCGWVLGPEQDRTLLDKVLPKDVAVSAINRQVGNDPVDPSFGRVSGRGKWAIPWMEDDPGLTMPQLWAGRMRYDAMDAKEYGCTGLMGIHWRTRTIAPNIAALADAGWDQTGFRRASGKERDFTDGQTAAYSDPIAGTDDDPLYQDVRYNMTAYRLAIPNGTYTVTLKFCEVHYNEPGKRVFDVTLQGKPVIEGLDIFAKVGKDVALDYTFPGVKVTNGQVVIGFPKRVEFPAIAAIAIEGPNGTRKINCGGVAYRDYAADVKPAPHSLPTVDFYTDWASTEFELGPVSGRQVGRMFAALDGNLPRPAGWINGPGGIAPDPRPWGEARKEYAPVASLANMLESLVAQRKGAEKERTRYWIHTLRYLEAMGRVRCAWGAFNAAMVPVNAEKDLAARDRLARGDALSARRALVRAVRDAYSHLLQTISTTGELGTIANWEQHIRPALLDDTRKQLAAALTGPLPKDADPDTVYHGQTRIIIPAVRTSVALGERLAVRVLTLSESGVKEAALYWAPMGNRAFRRLPLRHVSRGVFSVTLPPAGGDLEYYVKVVPTRGAPAVYPASAPYINQTVVLGPRF